MDKSWIHLKNRASEEYFNGVEQFLEFAFINETTTKCPCKKCMNRFFMDKDTIRGHLIWNGFWTSYTRWDLHGETLQANEDDNASSLHQNVSHVGDDMVGMVHDALGMENFDEFTGNEESPISDPFEGADEETKKLLKLIEDAQQPLYEGCNNFTSLSFLVRLLNVKVTCKMSNKAVTEILNALREAFPDARLPKSYYEAQKITSNLGFSYETWDACKNNCMLYRNEDKDLDRCTICQCSRYREVDPNNETIKNGAVQGKRIPQKQVRYFPLKPRLKRLFMSVHTASLMKWHASEERTNDGVMRHPADSLAWKDFDERHPQFGSDPRNVRFGLASDGFNPYGNMSSSHSTWPIVLIPYNLPPWLCMKQSNFILSVLIDGPDGPGDKIDVYLQPLIEELKDLWDNGFDTYDASSKEMFKLRAALMWTINDFPAYANLSGWSTKGRFACPCCNKKTKSRWLYSGTKFCYLGHRRWLKSSHKFRRDKMAFDGNQEWDEKPKVLSGSELLDQLKNVGTVYKKEDIFRKREMEAKEKEVEKQKRAAARKENQKRKRKRQNVLQRKSKDKKKERCSKNSDKTDSWKKRSIFFELPYWEFNLIRHNLDVMHIEKNVCDSIIYTLLGTFGKSKDSINARLDMKMMGIRKPLHPREGVSGSKKLAPASFTMSKTHKEVFLKVLKNVKVPDGYASNISRRVHLKDCTLKGLKSHDNHILLQQLLPLAIRKALPKKVVKVLIEVTNFFRKLCSKVNRKTDLVDIQERIALALCHLEKIFPPAFFDIMMHLPIHLAEEALIAGPVQYRWMYPIERYLQTLKQYVRNRARPEGSIAQGYILEECMTFCARYLKDVETKSNRPIRNYDGEDNMGCHFGKAETFYLDRITREQAHRYVLANTEAIAQYRQDHLLYIKEKYPRATDRQIHATHNDQFSAWFKEHVGTLEVANNDSEKLEEIRKLAAGPIDQARRFSGFNINGFRFRTKERNNSKVTSNSGVCIEANTRSYASTKDKNPILGDVIFYGELKDIIEITYGYDMKIVLFNCDWVDNKKGKLIDEFNLTSINFNHLLYRENKVTDEPFILASQAVQAIYVQDPVDPEWHVAIKMTSRDLFDMYNDENSVVVVPQVQPYSLQQLDETRLVIDDESEWVREGVEEIEVDATKAAAAYKKLKDTDNSDSNDSDSNDSDTDNSEEMDED